MIRNRDLIKTTMLLTVSMILSSVAVGCGAGTDENEVNNDTEVVAEVQTEVKETVYDEVAVGMQYSGLITKDAVLYSTSDLNGKVADLKLDEIVTVTHHLYLDGKEMDIYKVKTESGIIGYISGVDAKFNLDIDSEEDVLANLEEIEGGDGTESTEIVESMDVVEEQQTEEAFEPYIMYTNTNCNVRAQASKDSDLVGTAPVNTEIRVVGVEGDWSKVEFNAIQCYIKSSLLSKDKTVVTQSSSSSGSSQSSGGNQSSQTSDSSSSSGSSTSKEELDDLFAELGWDDVSNGGTGGYDGGSTGGTGDGGGMNYN